MKKLDFGQTVSLLANVGVIAGIVFLGYEMRQNTIALNSTAAQAVHDQITATFAMLTDDSMEGVMGKALNSPFTLTAAEASKASAFLSSVFYMYQNVHFQIQEGVYDPGLADGYWQEMRDNFEQPGYQLFWETSETLFSAEFRDFVENEVMAREPRETDFIGTISPRDER